MTPWPSAFSNLEGVRIKLLKTRPSDGDDEPGTIIVLPSKDLAVATGKGLLIIDELQPEGKKVMSGKAFLSGRVLREGAVRARFG
jgi:methionyl-tRNA formyltransferase